MAGQVPRPLPPRPPGAAPAGSYDRSEQHQHQQQAPYGQHPSQLPFQSQGYPQVQNQQYQHGAWPSFGGSAPLPQPPGQPYPQAFNPHMPGSVAQSWSVSPAPLLVAPPTQQPAFAVQHQEAARPDPLAVMTFQATAAGVPGGTASPVASRPPLPVPPTHPDAHPSQIPDHQQQHHHLDAWASQAGAHGAPINAAPVPGARQSFGPGPNRHSGWIVEPAPLSAAHDAVEHGPLPLPYNPPMHHHATSTRLSYTGVATSPPGEDSSTQHRPYSRPASTSFNASPSPSPRPNHRFSESSASVQQLAASRLQNRIDEATPMPQPADSSNPWNEQNVQNGTSRPHARPVSSAGYFHLNGSSSSPSFATTPSGIPHSRPVTFVPQGWSLVSASPSQSDSLLAPPTAAASSFSSPRTSMTSNDGTPPARDDDDRVSILSLGSRRAAFSKDLADPDFLANMGIIARDVPLREHVKGSLTYQDTFTGKELVTTLQEVIPVELFVNPHEATSSEQQMHYARLAAVQVADALREQNLFHEVELDDGEFLDSDNALYAFSDEMLVRVGPAPRRPPALTGSAQSSEPGAIDGQDGDRGEGSSTGASAAARMTRNGRGPQRSKTMKWSDTITPELRSSLGKYEVQRQNATLETIEREEQFLSDLELLQDLFVEGLKAKNVIAAKEHDDFVKVVFGNHRQLASHIRGLVEELHVRRAEHYPEIREVGDLFLNAALGWAEEYCSAITNYPFAANRVQKEESKNPAFRTFLEECLRDPRAQRLSLTTFLYRPVVRLQRYHLHFKAIIDAIEKARAATEQTASNVRSSAARELDNLNMVSSIVHTQVENAQRDLSTSQYKVDIANFAEAFAATSKRSEFDVDMDLANPERQLKHKGLVFLDGVKMHAILFDNYFVLAKEPKTLGDQPPATQRLVLARRPIPVELLQTSGFTSQSVSTSLALKFMHLSSSARKVSRQVWPFTISHRHRKAETYTLTVSQDSARREWQKKFEDACNMRNIVQEAVKAWTVSTVNDDGFAVQSASALESARDPTFRGTVTCSARFNVVLEGQKRPCVAMATEQGLFVGSRLTSSLQKVLLLKNVTQIAIMDQLDVLFVLADKVLWVCRLVDLFVQPTSFLGSSSSASLQQVSARDEEVLYFSIGVLDSMRVVVYSKKKPYDRGTAFVTLETTLDPGWSMRGPFPMRGANSPQFKPFGNGRFEYPAEVFSIQFRRKGLCLSTARGFELCNLGRNESPDFLPVPAPAKKEDLRGQALFKRIKAAKPMSLFKITDKEFLLCYNTFGCFVNADRTIARDGAVLEWETEPQAFIFRAPYLIAVDPQVVEIRIFNTVETAPDSGSKPLSGRLLQFFSGEEMCLLNSQANDTVDLMPAYDAPGPTVVNPLAGVEPRDPDSDAIILRVLKRPKTRNAHTFQAVVEVIPLQYANTTPAPRRWT